MSSKPLALFIFSEFHAFFISSESGVSIKVLSVLSIYDVKGVSHSGMFAAKLAPMLTK